ncbi:D-alanyl-D-alanine carboxypeptidase [Paracoccus isoporae]|uniref:D-alanyl-D-alanine carboxypeptidase n=1 Tax=Paracoccus isoporae TaxID=591205 RepID=A0A1G7DJH8_9RHOB|nr:serine hydrolase [Paracoccus isoporae]SDE51663.1 D-alanyl-D-alanine carboxypeptidase [Paracoccus isoporae]
MTRFSTTFRAGLLTLLAFLIPLAAIPKAAQAAPFAAFVMDGRTGKQIHAQNADTRLHPASLTKMMTLYMAFTAIERGQVRLDTKFTISTNAANEVPSRLGLRAGQRIELRYLIRAAAIKSANDAATAIGENLAGSEDRFAAQMTGMAKALGMNNTQFRNANGLTQSGHFSTARDMTTLGRRLFYDFPQYYSIFSRRSADAGIATVRSTNRTFLDNYSGADGIKTGYTRAAGFNLTASAQRGSKRIIATVLGGTSTAQRNATMAKLLDMGFGRAPTRVREIKPEPPQYIVSRKSSRKVAEAVKKSAAPAARPASLAAATAAQASVRTESLNSALNAAMAQAASQPPKPQPQQQGNARKGPARLASSARPPARPGGARQVAQGAATDAAVQAAMAETGAAAGAVLTASARPVPSPRREATPRAVAAASTANVVPAAASQTDLTLNSSPKPERRSDTVIISSGGSANGAPEPKPSEKISRASSSGGQAWGVSLGRFKSREQADARLIQVAMQESARLQNALRHVRESSKGYEATLVGLSKVDASATCASLSSQQMRCDVTAP